MNKMIKSYCFFAQYIIKCHGGILTLLTIRQIPVGPTVSIQTTYPIGGKYGTYK